MNLLNITLALLFVSVFSWGVKGVALATLISEGTAFLIGLLLIRGNTVFQFKVPSIQKVLDLASLRSMMNVNRDLFIRTLCLLTVLNLFTAKGASFGTTVLAANAVLIQIHYIIAYLFDGFANASSILVGKATGSGDERLYKRSVVLSGQWALLSSFVIAGLYFLLSDFAIPLFTHIPNVIHTANTYGVWIILYPLCASFGLVFYGIFTGSTQAVPIRNSMIMALVVFLASQFLIIPIWGNHGLWFAFILFSLGRSVFLCMYLPKLTRTLFPVKTIPSQPRDEPC
jgi:MATE family multidrug resistance protein